MASGLPDPTAALETYVAAGGCPLSDLLGLLSRAVRSVAGLCQVSLVLS